VPCAPFGSRVLWRFSAPCSLFGESSAKRTTTDRNELGMTTHRQAPSQQPVALERASESISARFTRPMKAATSRFGSLTDPPILALPTALFLLALLASLQLGVSAPIVTLFGALLVLPLTIGVLMTIALSGARRRVVDWLARLPFPLENMNAVLNGLGE